MAKLKRKQSDQIMKLKQEKVTQHLRTAKMTTLFNDDFIPMSVDIKPQNPILSISDNY